MVETVLLTPLELLSNSGCGVRSPDYVISYFAQNVHYI